MKAVRLYAQVLLDTAQSAGSSVDFGALMSELGAFSRALSESALAQKTFESPAVSEEEKVKALNALCDKLQVAPLSRRFLVMLARRGRLESLDLILRAAEALQVERKGGLNGEVVSAVPLDSATLSGVIEALSKRLQKPVHLSARVDARVLAGMKITINGVTYDGTVRSKLDRLVSPS